MRSVLLLEDHLPTAAWLIDVAQNAFPATPIVHCGTLEAARQWLERNLCFIALLDIHLPDGSGIDLIPVIRSQQQDATIVMTTVFDDNQHLFDALRAGAQGYLLKEQSAAALTEKLAGIYKGEPPLSPGIARRILAHFSPDATPAPSVATKPKCDLSPRETETLTILAKGYSIKELARLLEISDHTAAGYVKSIYRKLNISNRAEATLEAARRGLVAN